MEINWNALSAIATFMASIIALWVALRPRKANIQMSVTLVLCYLEETGRNMNDQLPKYVYAKAQGFNYGDLGDAISSIQIFDKTNENEIEEPILCIDQATPAVPNSLINMQSDLKYTNLKIKNLKVKTAIFDTFGEIIENKTMLIAKINLFSGKVITQPVHIELEVKSPMHYKHILKN